MEIILTAFLVSVTAFMIAAIIACRNHVRDVIGVQDTADRILRRLEAHQAHFDNLYRNPLVLNRLDCLQKSQDSIIKRLESFFNILENVIEKLPPPPLLRVDKDSIGSKILSYMKENDDVQTAHILDHLLKNQDFKPKNRHTGHTNINVRLKSFIQRGFVKKSHSWPIRWNLTPEFRAKL